LLDLVRRAEPTILRVIRKNRLAARATIVSENGFCLRHPDGRMHSDNHRDDHKRFHTVASFWLQFPRAASVASARADCSCCPSSVIRLLFYHQNSKNIHPWLCAFISWRLHERLRSRQDPSSHILRNVRLILETIGSKVCLGGKKDDHDALVRGYVYAGINIPDFLLPIPTTNQFQQDASRVCCCASGGPGAGQHVLGRGRSRQRKDSSSHCKIHCGAEGVHRGTQD